MDEMMGDAYMTYLPFSGTTERICLIVGTIEACQNAHEEISKIINEKPDPHPKPSSDGDGKINYHRHNQVSSGWL